MTVIFKVDETLLTDYIKFLFPEEKDTTYLKVSGSHPFGKLVIANISVSGRPVAPPEGANIVTLHLPKQDATQDLANKFLYYTAGAICRLNAAPPCLCSAALSTALSTSLLYAVAGSAGRNSGDNGRELFYRQSVSAFA